MKKEILNLKLQLFKQTVSDYQISKKGNHWGYLGNKQLERCAYTINYWNVTKNSIDKLFQTIDYSKNMSTLLMMTPRGKLFIKQPIEKRFKAVAIRTCPPSLLKLFLFGRKSEWLCIFPELAKLKIFHSFKSLKEVKLYLGYGFISDSSFELLLNNSNYLNVIFYGKNLTHSDRVNMVHHKFNMLLSDAINMSVQLNEPISIPESKEKLKIWHGDLVSKKNSEKASQYSDKKIHIESWLFDYWAQQELDFKILDSPRKLFLQGCKQNHCLASYSTNMINHIYVSFNYEDKQYDTQIHKTKGIVQCYGYRNQSPPKELISKIKPLSTETTNGYFTIIEETKPNEKHKSKSVLQTMPVNTFAYDELF